MDVIELLRERIREEKEKKSRAIVFWYDSDQQETITSIQEALKDEDIIVREVTENNFFKLKIDIEVENPKKSFLLYAPFPRPKDEENYLLDILLYGSEFKADQIAIWSEQLGIEDVILRPIVQKYPAFFKSNERVNKLKKIVPFKPREEELEIGMLAVLTNTLIGNLSTITRNLLCAGLDKEQNELYKRISKFFSIERMWELFEQHFGLHHLKEKDNLNDLLDNLLFQHFSRDALFEIEHLSNKYSSTRSNICALLIDDWMRGTNEEKEILESYIRTTESTWQLQHYLQEKTVEEIEKVTTFPIIDAILIEKVRNELLYKTTDLTAWKERITFRQKTYWGSKEKFSGLYTCLYHAVKLTEYKTNLKQYDSREDLYGQYVHSLHYIDQAYRQFMYAYSNLLQRDFIDSLEDKLTNWYENIYLRKLADETNYYLENEQKTRIPLQRRFFRTNVQPILEKEPTKVFVIISDALRYEAGYELCQQLNQLEYGEASISPLFASLPSYTQLGMASLLPFKQLAMDESKTIYADGISSLGIVNRIKILQNAHKDAIAYRWDEFDQWTQTEADAHFKGKRLIYIYHDVIDAVGDSRKSERDTYGAVGKAIKELKMTVERLSRLQAKRIFITADHGFLFQYPKIEADVKIEPVKGTIYDSNRRFAIGNNLSVPYGAIKLQEKDTPLKDVEVVIAKGLNRFTGGGGSQFVHGGAMPQEVIVPLIEYRRTEKAEPVEVSVAMLDKVITNYRFTVSFYQEQSISSDALPRQIKAAFYLGNERISNEVTISFDMVGANHERTKQVMFTLIEKYYAMGEFCTLRLETVNDKKTEPYKEETFIIKMYEALY
ncbi:BREX-1 system phosphatase PglZ type A [Caldibacillus thermoamylovorans]|nr:BREX-1 system phosphatase PglZ type A [Caldibacillus thermoamylovorans]